MKSGDLVIHRTGHFHYVSNHDQYELGIVQSVTDDEIRVLTTTSDIVLPFKQEDLILISNKDVFTVLQRSENRLHNLASRILHAIDFKVNAVYNDNLFDDYVKSDNPEYDDVVCEGLIGGVYEDLEQIVVDLLK